MTEPLTPEDWGLLTDGWRKGSTWHMSPEQGERIIATLQAVEAERDELREKAAAWDSIPTPADGPASTADEWRQAYIERMREGVQARRERDEQRARAERWERLANRAYALGAYGKYAPGSDDTWAQWEADARALADQDPTPPGVEAVTYYTVRCAACVAPGVCRLTPAEAKEGAAVIEKVGWTLGEDGRYRCPGCAEDGGSG